MDILRSYGDRFRWISEKDQGQTDAINKGFARSQGDIRAYLNSDDVIAPDAVARAVRHFQRNPSCDLLYGRADYIDEQDSVIGTYATAEYSFARLMQDCCICQPAAFWRTRVARQIGPFDDRLHYAMDYDYWLRIDRAGGRIVFLPELLACSRLYPQTKTQSARRAIYREIFAVCQRHGGYVHKHYFHGLWYHLCEERKSGLTACLAGRPRIREAIASLHHRWWNLRPCSCRRLLGGAGRRLKHYAVRGTRFVLSALGVFAMGVLALSRRRDGARSRAEKG